MFEGMSELGEQCEGLVEKSGGNLFINFKFKHLVSKDPLYAYS